MGKLIPVSELRLGMYIEKFEGSWFRHPFWRSSFLLTVPEDLAAIRTSELRQVWVDPARSQPAPAAAVRGAGQASQGQESASAPSPSLRVGNRGPGDAVPFAAEVERARKLCQAGKSQVMDMFTQARLGKAIDPSMTQPLLEEISASVSRHPHALISVARLKTHDDYTYLHSFAVCALMLSLARQLGLDEAQTRLAAMGGLMHDLGKAAMPLEVLNKPGKLTDAEFAVMRQHPVEGARMLRESSAAAEVTDIALHHHERIDGTGYPDRLQGDAISLLARMGAVCDVYDAVTSQRVYHRPWDPGAAVREMARWEGHFDRVIFEAFVKAVGIYPVGSLVRLSSHRLAVVVESGVESLLTPKVRAFFSLRRNEPIRLETIDLGAPGCTDRIVAPEDPQRWNFPYLDELSVA